MTTLAGAAEVPVEKLGMRLRILGVVAIVFGVLTIKEGSAVLFFDGEARAAAGSYVPFVLMFNTFAGAFYVAAGAGILLRKRWAGHLAVFLAVTTGLVFAGLGVAIFLGTAYESRTIGAMTLRTLFWMVTAAILQRSPVFCCRRCNPSDQGSHLHRGQK